MAIVGDCHRPAWHSSGRPAPEAARFLGYPHPQRMAGGLKAHRLGTAGDYPPHRLGSQIEH